MTSDTEPSPADPRFAETTEPDVVWEPYEAGPTKASLCVWGPWATIGWTVLCAVVILVVQTITVLLFLTFHAGQDFATALQELNTDGNLQATATLLTTPCIIGLVVFLVRLHGCPIRAYLALSWPPARSVVMAFVGLAIVLFSVDLLSYSQGRPLVPEVMVEFYRQSWLPYLLFAIVVLAPWARKRSFVGFFTRGWQNRVAGPSPRSS